MFYMYEFHSLKEANELLLADLKNIVSSLYIVTGLTRHEIYTNAALLCMYGNYVEITAYDTSKDMVGQEVGSVYISPYTGGFTYTLTFTMAQVESNNVNVMVGIYIDPLVCPTLYTKFRHLIESKQHVLTNKAS